MQNYVYWPRLVSIEHKAHFCLVYHYKQSTSDAMHFNSPKAQGYARVCVESSSKYVHHVVCSRSHLRGGGRPTDWLSTRRIWGWEIADKPTTQFSLSVRLSVDNSVVLPWIPTHHQTIPLGALGAVRNWPGTWPTKPTTAQKKIILLA